MYVFRELKLCSTCSFIVCLLSVLKRQETLYSNIEQLLFKKIWLGNKKSRINKGGMHRGTTPCILKPVFVLFIDIHGSVAYSVHT